MLLPYIPTLLHHQADFDSGVAIHPTAAEEMVTMGAWGRAPSEKYGWKTNMCYGTRAHMEAVEKYGPTEYHRKSFNLYPGGS